MIKKAVITLLTVFYLSVSFGANVSMHYCMGELVEWDINSHSEGQEKECDKCGMPSGTSDGCCKYEQKQVKLDNDQKISKSEVKFKLLSTDLLPQQLNLQTAVPALSGYSHNYSANSPPSTLKTAAFILFCNFRI